MSFKIDNTKYINMMNKPPAIDTLPPLNKRVLAQNTAFRGFFYTSFALIGYYILDKWSKSAHASRVKLIKRDFSFESDPYTQMVKV